MPKNKKKADKILDIGQSPLNDDWSVDQDEEFAQRMEGSLPEGETMMISGEMGIGKDRNPVTIIVMDEVTGAEMEMAHVKNAMIVVEDERKSTSGWLSLIIGDTYKLGEVLQFIAKATIDELRRMISSRF